MWPRVPQIVCEGARHTMAVDYWSRRIHCLAAPQQLLGRVLVLAAREMKLSRFVLDVSHCWDERRQKKNEVVGFDDFVVSHLKPQFASFQLLPELFHQVCMWVLPLTRSLATNPFRGHWYLSSSLRYRVWRKCFGMNSMPNGQSANVSTITPWASSRKNNVR